MTAMALKFRLVSDTAVSLVEASNQRIFLTEAAAREEIGFYPQKCFSSVSTFCRGLGQSAG